MAQFIIIQQVKGHQKISEKQIENSHIIHVSLNLDNSILLPKLNYVN